MALPVLAIESSTPTASVALVREGDVVAEDVFQGHMTLAEQLAPRIGDLLARAGLPLADLSGIAVSLGPGSFTGLRIGVATAKAIAHATGIPLVGVPTADAVAESVAWAGAPRVHVVLAAWRDQFWVASYACSEGQPVADPGEPRLLPASGLVDALGQSEQLACVAGTLPTSLREAIRDSLGHRLILPPASVSRPRASMVAALAQARLSQGAYGEIHALRPLYYRRSQAELTKGVDLGL